MADILIRAGSFVGIILIGFLLKKAGIFREQDFSVLSNTVMKVTFPAAIITNFAGKQIDPSLLILAALAFAFGLAYILLAFLVNLRSDRDQRAFDMLNLPGYNIGNFTMPFVQSFLGPIGVITTGIFDIGNAVICLGGSFGIASTVKDGSGFSVKRILKSLSKSIPFVTYLIMLVIMFAQIKLPTFILEFTSIVGSANPFLAMFMIGVGFKIHGAPGQTGKILRLLALRYGMSICLALLVWFVLPFQLEVRQALVILVFSPIGTAVPPFTAELKGDVGLSSAVNSIAILISIAINVVLLSVIL
jgi:predicted permease